MPRKPVDLGDVASVTLVDIARGALVERFDVELHRVLENIHDQNTPVKKARKMAFEFSFEPTGGKDGNDRGEVMVDITTKLRLCEDNGIRTTFHTGRIGGSGAVVALEYDPRQLDMFQPGQEPSAQPAIRGETPTVEEE